jgi:RecA-family ATPase
MGSRPRQFTLTAPGPLRLYNTLELLNMPDPTWLIEPILPDGALVGMYGAPETCKSFIAIDLALSVATGTPWQGYETKKGFVVYIAAEGGAGLKKRALAWLATHQIEPQDADIAWLIESVPLNADSDEIVTLLGRLEDEVRREPAMIVVDTMARCFDGNENETEDMGRFIAGIDILRKRFGSVVLVVHHAQEQSGRERGSKAFRAGVETMLRVTREKDSDHVLIECDKQKDAEHFEDIELEKVVVAGTDSCVMKGSNAPSQRKSEAEAVIDILRAHQPCSWQDWVNASGLDAKAFMKVYQTIRKMDKVSKHKKTNKWSVIGAEA